MRDEEIIRRSEKEFKKSRGHYELRDYNERYNSKSQKEKDEKKRCYE